MSDTPETNAATVRKWNSDATCDYWVPDTFARRLERERDQAKQDAKQSELDAIRALGERNDARAERDAYKAQRDRLAAELQDWKDAAEESLNPHPDEVHCTCVPLLQAANADLKKQRDRLVAALEEIADSHDAPQNDQTAREALAAVKGGES